MCPPKHVWLAIILSCIKPWMHSTLCLIICMQFLCWNATTFLKDLTWWFSQLFTFQETSFVFSYEMQQKYTEKNKKIFTLWCKVQDVRRTPLMVRGVCTELSTTTFVTSWRATRPSHHLPSCETSTRSSLDGIYCQCLSNVCHVCTLLYVYWPFVHVRYY